ncbi:hypothetical protein K438DRAFT_1593742 [Mycena galopus ATCC 62051]|nr:hypothetical protein K438DRAFT_1593742 [Mycena galopus ATCC 62051]
MKLAPRAPASSASTVNGGSTSRQSRLLTLLLVCVAGALGGEAPRKRLASKSSAPRKSTTSAADGVKKPHRFRPGTIAIKSRPSCSSVLPTSRP